MVQTPANKPVTVVPEIVQIPIVVLVSTTGSPEVAVALTVPVPARTIEGAGPKLIVWLAFGVVLFEAADAALVPTLFVAVTVKV